MRVFTSTTQAFARHRLILAALLSFLCIPIFFYHLVPSFTQASDQAVSSLAGNLLGQNWRGSFCTKEVGDARCCTIYLDAAPCIDECRQRHVSRVSYALTEEYDECADACLVKYNQACRRDGVKGES